MLNAVTHEPLNPPSFIGQDGIELIDVGEIYGLPLHWYEALQHMVAAQSGSDRDGHLRKARFYLDRWLEDPHGNCQAADPDEDCLEWQNPQDIVKAFNLTGYLATAAIYILNAAAFHGEDELEIQKALIALEAE